MSLNSNRVLMSDHAKARRRELVNGLSKTVFDGPEPGTHVLYFKDDLTLNGEVKTVSGKGILNNRISELLMTRLNDLGIETHFIRTLNMREQLVRATEQLPFYVTLHNVASGSFAKRLGLSEGMILSKPIPEFSLRSKRLGNPIVAAEHLNALGWSRFEEIDEILITTQRVNDFLSGQFLALNLKLISFTLEFGRYYTIDHVDTHLMVTDELSPETCNLLDLSTGKRLDLQGMQDAPNEANLVYQQVARSLGVLGLENPEDLSASSSRSILPLEKPRPRKTPKKRNVPHGHNSR